MYKINRINQDHNLIPNNLIYRRIGELMIPKVVFVALVSILISVSYTQGCKMLNDKLVRRAAEIRRDSVFNKVENMRNKKKTVEDNIETATIELREIESALGQNSLEETGSGEQVIYKVSNYILENKPSNLTLIMLEDSNTYITYSQSQGTGYVKNITDFENGADIEVIPPSSDASSTADPSAPAPAPAPAASTDPADPNAPAAPAEPAGLAPEIVAQFDQNPYGVITLADGTKVNPTTDEWNSYKAQYIELKSKAAAANGYEVNEYGEKIDRDFLTHKESGLSRQLVLHGFATNRLTLSEFSDILSECPEIESYKILAMEKIMLEDEEIHLFELEINMVEEGEVKNEHED